MFGSSRYSFAAFIAIAALVLAGIILGWLQFSEYKNKHSQERHDVTAHKAEQPREQRQAVCISVDGSYSYPCTVDEYRTDNSEKYTYYDLHAQQDMAEWALAMAAISFLGVLVTAAATFYVALTFHETRKMAGDSAEATRAAFQMVEADRAWILHDATAFSMSPSVDGKNFQIASGFRNFGRTPARCVKSAWQFRTLPDSHEFTPDVDLLNKIISGETETIVAPGEVQWGASTLTHAEFMQVTKFGYVLYIAGKFTYADIHETAAARETFAVHKVVLKDDGKGQTYSTRISLMGGSIAT